MLDEKEESGLLPFSCQWQCGSCIPGAQARVWLYAQPELSGRLLPLPSYWGEARLVSSLRSLTH